MASCQGAKKIRKTGDWERQGSGVRKDGGRRRERRRLED